jgi:hypothetical protein
MDSMMKLYLYNHWIEDQNEQVELLKDHGMLIGFFTNPEAVQNMLKGTTIAVSDENVEATMKLIRDQDKAPKHRRRKKNKKENDKLNG